MMKKQIIIDTHAHIGYWPNLLACENEILTSMYKYNIAYSLISFDGSEFKNSDNARSRLLPQILASKKCFKFVKEHDNLGMLIWVRPATENNFKDVDTFIEHHKKYVHGIKFHPFCSKLRITSPKFKPYLEIARKYNLPILVHTATDKYSKLKYLTKVALANPDINFVAAHLELESDHLKALETLKNVSNLYGDTAWVDPEILDKVKELNLFDKLMFGTDNPIDGEDTLSNPFYQSYINNDFNLTQGEYNKLMYKNALKIYNINKKFN